MIAVVQLVNRSSVSVFNSQEGKKIEHGFLVFLCLSKEDTQKQADLMVSKLLKLRIFPDKDQKMNLDIITVKGGILLIPQFTLLGNIKGNNRPDFSQAARPEQAEGLFNYIADKLDQAGVTKTGFFGENMQIKSLLTGPVTIIIDTDKL